MKVVTEPKTNWFSLISAMVAVCGFLISIGGLVLSPINKEVDELRKEFAAHQELKLHPVGAEQIAKLQVSLEKSITDAEGDLVKLKADIKDRESSLANENAAKAQLIQAQIETLRDKSIPSISDRVLTIQLRMEQLEKRLDQLDKKQP